MLKGHVRFAVAPYAEANRLQTELARKGISIELLHNQATCKSGCGVKLEIWVPESEISQVHSHIHQQWQDLLELEQQAVNIAWTESVFNPELNQATCPACGTDFSTNLSACPECGLCFA